jgi:hypothetical protein
MSGYRVREESSRLQDIDTIARIDELVTELRQLRAGISLADPLTAAARRRMSDLGTELDELWSAVRRRRSNGYFGRDLVGVARGT